MSADLTPVILPYEGTLPRIAAPSFVAPGVVLVGDVTIAEEASIWFGCVLRGDVNDIRIGARTNIQDGTVVHVASNGQGAHVGARVTVGHMALIHACTIEDDAFIGMKACVMDDAVVESGAMVAAGAVVTPGKRVIAGQLWAGIPAKPVRALTEAERAANRRSADHYWTVAQRYLPQGG